MPWYLCDSTGHGTPVPETREECDVGLYGSALWARNDREAEKVAQRRGVRERVVCKRECQAAPYTLVSQYLSKHAPITVSLLHSAIYTAWLAIKSGVATADDLLADAGMVHQLAHRAVSPRDRALPTRKELAARFAELERRIPGFVGEDS